MCQSSKNPKIQKSKVPKIQKSKVPKIQKSKVWEIASKPASGSERLLSKLWIFGFLAIFQTLDFWIFGTLDFWILGTLDFGIFGTLDFGFWPLSLKRIGRSIASPKDWSQKQEREKREIEINWGSYFPLRMD